MSGARFLEHYVPATIEEMNELLEECTPDDMSPLIECLTEAEKTIESNRLKFEDFLSAIAYPIQSYSVNADSKIALFVHVKRLYPHLEDEHTKKLRTIIMRMRLDGQPVFNNLESLESLPVSACYQDSFLGIDCKSGRVDGYIDLLSMPVQERLTRLLEKFPSAAHRSPKELAETYQTILNLLHLELRRVQQSWNWVGFARAKTVLFEEYYQLSERVILLSPHMEVDTCPSWNDASEDDFAFAIQREGLLSRIIALSSLKEKKHRNELFKLYHGLLNCSVGSVNPRIPHFLALLRKDLAYNKLEEIVKQFVIFDKEYHGNPTIKIFTTKVEQDLITPCNSALLNIDRQYLEGEKNARSEYTSISRARGQQIKDTRAVCEYYQRIADSQVKLYAHVYQLLKDLVSKQKHKAEWMQYFKIFIKTQEHPQTLPEQLSLFPQEEFDARSEILKELEKPAPQVWPISPTALPKEKAKKKIKTEKRAAFSLATESVSQLVSEAPKDEESGASAAAAADDIAPISHVPENASIRPITVSLQTLPTPFQYADRVLRWFNAKPPLDPVIFQEYANSTLDYQRLMITYHAFTCSVDSFVIKLALELPWINPKKKQAETRYVLPAEILDPELGSSKMRGVITYCVGQGNRVYHRFFSERTTEKVVRDISEQTFKEADFPSLSQAVDENMSRVEVLSTKDSADKIVTHPFWGTVKITNEKGVEVTLYPVKHQ